MVTLYYMRRYVRFLQQTLAHDNDTVELSTEVSQWLDNLTRARALFNIQQRLDGGQQIREALLTSGLGGVLALLQLIVVLGLMLVYSPTLTLVYLAVYRCTPFSCSCQRGFSARSSPSSRRSPASIAASNSTRSKASRR